LFRLLGNSAELIRLGGYAALATIVFTETGLLVGFFLPGDSLLVTAGLFAATGHLEIVTLLGILFAAATLGDATGYFIGRSTGPVLFANPESRLFRRDHLLRSRVFYEQHGGKTVILARFVPVVRTFVPVLAGVSGMSRARFTVYNLTGALLWVGSMTMTGYLLGRTIPGIDRYIEIVVGLVVLLSLAPVAVEMVRSRRKTAEHRTYVCATTRQLAAFVTTSTWDWTPRTIEAIVAGLESVCQAVAILTPLGDGPPRPTRLATDEGPGIELVVESSGAGLSEAAAELTLLELSVLFPAVVAEVSRIVGSRATACVLETDTHCWLLDGAHLAVSLRDERPRATRIVMTVSPLRSSAPSECAAV